jgi:hypothetical protein
MSLHISSGKVLKKYYWFSSSESQFSGKLGSRALRIQRRRQQYMSSQGQQPNKQHIVKETGLTDIYTQMLRFTFSLGFLFDELAKHFITLGNGRNVSTTNTICIGYPRKLSHLSVLPYFVCCWSFFALPRTPIIGVYSDNLLSLFQQVVALKSTFSSRFFSSFISNMVQLLYNPDLECAARWPSRE